MTPLFSVVIPTYNRADALATVLDAWQKQEPFDLTFELILVDDGSTDDTRGLLGSLRSSRFSWRILTQENTGPAGARNLGMGHARGELVMFSGDDIEPSTRLLAEHLDGHTKSGDPNSAVLGLTQWPIDAQLSATMRHIDGVGAQQFSYAWLKDGCEYDFRHFYTSNISVRRELLQLEPGGFSTDFPSAAFEDAEFAYRLTAHGLRIVYRQSAVAFHHHPYDVRTFFARQRRCGEMAAILWQKKPALSRWTSIRELEWLRMQIVLLKNHARHHLSMVAQDLDQWHQRALALAGFYDHLEPQPKAQDKLLLALFQHGLLCGLAEGLLPKPQAQEAAAASFLALLPKAAAAYRTGLREENLPCPVADCEALVGLFEP